MPVRIDSTNVFLQILGVVWFSICTSVRGALAKTAEITIELVYAMTMLARNAVTCSIGSKCILNTFSGIDVVEVSLPHFRVQSLDQAYLGGHEVGRFTYDLGDLVILVAVGFLQRHESLPELYRVQVFPLHVGNELLEAEICFSLPRPSRCPGPRSALARPAPAARQAVARRRRPRRCHPRSGRPGSAAAARHRRW